MVLRLPLAVRHAVYDLPRSRFVEAQAFGFRRFLVPARHAIPAEAGEVHQGDVLHVGPLAKVRDQLSTDACIDRLNQELGTLSRDSGRSFIPKGTYKGQDVDVPTVVSAGELIINKDVPDNIAHTIITIICENTEELYKINPANKNFKPETGWKNVALPLHPGAERYYREAGFMK